VGLKAKRAKKPEIVVVNAKIKIECIFCHHKETVDLASINPTLGPTCSKCFGMCIVAGASARFRSK
jgi:hypothetical protein